MNKTVVLNLRPGDRLSQTSLYDGSQNHANCEFSLNKPISLRSNGKMALRSAYIPLTFKNVIEGTNDRFMIKFNPTLNATTFDDSVYISVQIPAGQYDTSTALALAINTVLAGTTDATVDGLLNTGGFCYSYSTDTNALLSTALTCVVDNTASNKNHLKFTLPATSVFASTSVPTLDGGTVANTAIAGGFQILFGGDGGGVVTTTKSPVGRQANKLLGFGAELGISTNGGTTPQFQVFPVAQVVRTGTAVVNVFSPTLASVLFTPYIYVRCNLISDSIESRPRGSKISNVLAKIPVTSSGYGDVQYMEPDDLGVFFNIANTDLQNIQIQFTDTDGVELPLQQSDWEIELIFNGIFN